jgi:adenylate cyclase
MLSAKRIFWTQLIVSVICTALVAGSVLTVYLFGGLKRADNILYDLRIKWRGTLPTSGHVVLVLMDEKSAKELKKPRGNWTRRQLTDALTNLCKAGAEIIGLDMMLSSPDQDPTADVELANAIDSCNNIILAWYSPTQGMERILPLPIFQDSMIGDGFIHLPLDEDEILRRISYLFAKPLDDGSLQLFPAFSLELVRTFLNIEFEFDFSLKDHIRLGADGGRQLLLPYPELLINYSGEYTVFPRISYSDAVLNRFSPDLVKGKIVIIGNALATDKDLFSTPYSRFVDLSRDYRYKFGTVVRGVLGTKEFGMACHAHAVETILRGQFIRPISEFNTMAWVIILGIVGLVFYWPRMGMVWSAVALISALVILTGVSYLIFLKKLLSLDSAPLMAVLLVQFVSGTVIQKYYDKKKSARVKNLFGRYVSAGVVEELIKGDLDTTLEGQRQELTILFSDLRNFTSLSEEMGAKDTRNLLNNYFDTMIPIVFNHHGTLDKLMGDGIMAFFGAPVNIQDHPIKAAEAALDMIDELNTLKQKSVRGIRSLDVGIGINSGTVTIGNLGSHDFMDYTIIGDAVNKHYRQRIYGISIRRALCASGARFSPGQGQRDTGGHFRIGRLPGYG